MWQWPAWCKNRGPVIAFKSTPQWATPLTRLYLLTFPAPSKTTPAVRMKHATHESAKYIPYSNILPFILFHLEVTFIFILTTWLPHLQASPLLSRKEEERWRARGVSHPLLSGRAKPWCRCSKPPASWEPPQAVLCSGCSCKDLGSKNPNLEGGRIGGGVKG